MIETWCLLLPLAKYSAMSAHLNFSDVEGLLQDQGLEEEWTEDDVSPALELSRQK